MGIYDWSALDKQLESFVPTTVPGLTFLLAKDGQVLYEKALGNQTLDSVLPIASATKMPSSLVILTLVQDGLIGLDEPIGTYLQGHIDVPADKAAITTRMLLNHTSGLNNKPACEFRPKSMLQTCAQEILNDPLQFAPGTEFAYGGGGFQVAGYLAEVVSGMSWNDLFQERLSKPLGLTQFSYTRGPLSSETNPRLASGASSNVTDYNKILQMILSNRNDGSGPSILIPETITMLTTSQISGLSVLETPADTHLYPGYSFGFWISDPSLYPGSNGPEVSDEGALGCTPWIDFDLGYSAVLLIKADGETGREIWNAIRPLIIDQLSH
jgi:Beta-lactamase class C and other penicillin binding proteins